MFVCLGELTIIGKSNLPGEKILYRVLSFKVNQKELVSYSTVCRNRVRCINDSRFIRRSKKERREKGGRLKTEKEKRE